MKAKPFKSLQIRIITLSDRASQGVYEDKSGPAILGFLEPHLLNNQWRINSAIQIIPDNADKLKSLINTFADEKIDLIFTTGGTGIGKRDITPDVIAPMLDKEIPGIMEMIRIKCGERIPNALLSRSIAGTIGQSLVYVLPGSVKAINDYMPEILKTMEHALFMLHGIDVH